jgi:excisionase family DNA binding protein
VPVGGALKLSDSDVSVAASIANADPRSVLDDPTLFTTQQAARILSVSSKTVQNWVNEGHLLAMRTPGGHRRITAAELTKTLQARAQVRDFVVLVLEDDKAMARWYELAFASEIPNSPARIRVSVVQSGWEGLQRVLKSPPDLLITDLRMEPLSGFDLLSALSSTYGQLGGMQIVVVTGLSPDELRAAAPLPARVKVLSKPVSLEQLRDCLDTAMRECGLPGPGHGKGPP